MFILLGTILLSSFCYAIIMPLTDKDGKVDLMSVINHLVLLEQTMEGKASGTEVEHLKSQFKTTQDQLIDTQREVAILQILLRSANSQCSCNSTPSTYGGGTIYTRWGSTTCPAGETRIYKGNAGGSHESKLPSSSTVLCLPEDPLYANHTQSGHNSHLYGAEYETGKYGAGTTWRNIDDEDIPCAVCQTGSKSAVIMVPGRNQCYSGWNLEYWGYLMGSQQGLGSSEIICVDHEAERVPGGSSNELEHSLYFMKGACGVLPCPPYENHWELTCAVCTQ